MQAQPTEQPTPAQAERARRKRAIEAATLLLRLERRTRNAMHAALSTAVGYYAAIGASKAETTRGITEGQVAALLLSMRWTRHHAGLAWLDQTGLTRPDDVRTVSDKAFAKDAGKYVGKVWRRELKKARAEAGPYRSTEGIVNDARVETAKRLDSVATTATTEAWNREQEAMAHAAERAGVALVYRWETEDADACDECDELDGQEWTSASDAEWPPKHPNCRCTLSTYTR